MRNGFAVLCIGAGLGLLVPSHHRQSPESELAAFAKAYLALALSTDWAGLERLPGTRWSPLPPTALQNCMPDGGCFTRTGTATVGGRSLSVMVTGSRAMVLNLYFRNTGTPIGEPAVVAALKAAGLGAGLARCPVRGGQGSTNWYRLSGTGIAPGYLSVQAARPGRQGEGFVLSAGEELPPLQPNQLALYSEQCASGAGQAPVSTLKPHEALADLVVTLLVPASGPLQYSWTSLAGLNTGITWNPGGPTRTDLSFRNDPGNTAVSGTLVLAGRRFSVQATGSQTQVKNIYLEEQGLHPRGEHMLGVVYTRGIAVGLVLCGPVYTQSTNNWYSLQSGRTRPAMILQSIRYEGNNVQDSYTLRLDGTLPPRDPRDRDPGAGGCQ